MFVKIKACLLLNSGIQKMKIYVGTLEMKIYVGSLDVFCRIDLIIYELFNLAQDFLNIFYIWMKRKRG
jgi:hypothetical protein